MLMDVNKKITFFYIYNKRAQRLIRADTCTNFSFDINCHDIV